MAEIRQLSPQVAARIAAGEVVERPASVIKELVENSIDALATHIVVEIQHGGVTYMRVSDNGKGMREEDAPTAFLRHATSKISTEEDLDSIATLGFRGEALYSIAAVSNVEITTKRKEDMMGTNVCVSGGGTPRVSPAGCPDGTSVIVRDLFFNTPARMKFLKKDSVEGGYVEEILRRIALARPDISFRFISGGKEIFFTPGDGKLENAVAAILGRDFATSMIGVEYSQDGMQISGLIGKSELTRPNRTFQIFFVNGRAVMHKSFYVALQEAYKGQIMQGRFPVCVLHINMDPALCDVNVHPSKAEIKFANEKPVFDLVYWGSKNALYAIRDTRTLSVSPVRPAFPVEERPKGEQTSLIPPMEVPETKIPKAEISKPELPKAEPPKPETPKRETNISAKGIPSSARPEDTFVYAKTEEKAEPLFAATPSAKPEAARIVPEVPKTPAPKEEPAMPVVRVLGQAFETYIVAEADGKLLLVDQHAAHERILYNALIEGMEGKGIDSQMLLLPQTVQLSPTEMSVFEENREVLAKSGFDAEEFGVGVLKISMIPAALTGCDVAATFLEVLDRLSKRQGTKTTAETNALHTIACRAALKAGKQLSCKEQEVLVGKALMLEGIATCPHGRPIILSLTQREIEKQFKRIV